MWLPAASPSPSLNASTYGKKLRLASWKTRGRVGENWRGGLANGPIRQPSVFCQPTAHSDVSPADTTGAEPVIPAEPVWTAPESWANKSLFYATKFLECGLLHSNQLMYSLLLSSSLGAKGDNAVDYLLLSSG